MGTTITRKPSGEEKRFEDMTREELLAYQQQLEAENKALKAVKRAKASEIYFKVSQKGAVSVYGMGRFPVTLYKEQWLRLLAKADDLVAFIEENSADLKTKEQ